MSGQSKKNLIQQYGFALFFAVMAVYQYVKVNYLEMSLYISVTTAFILLALAKDGYFTKSKKTVDLLSWILIAISGVLFLYVLLNDSKQNL